MRKILAYTFLFVFLFGYSAKAQPSPIPMNKKQGYFFSGSESLLDKGVNCVVIRELKEFEQYFGRGRADTPHFSKEWMLLLVMPATKKDIQLEFNRVSMKAGDFIEVYCNLNGLKGKMLTYEMNPLAVCTIPRHDKVQYVHFYEELKKSYELIETIEVKR